MNFYVVRSIARISVEFTLSEDDSPVDPTTVELDIVPPNGETLVVTTDIIRDGEGLYHYDYIVEESGVYRYRWQGEGAVIAAAAYQHFRGID